MSDFRDRADAIYASLLQRTGEGAPRPGLAPTRSALQLLGDPQRAYPVIQLTGTNGKTSTARMIDSLLQAHGLRTGRFTSPHVDRFTERIALNGEPISDEDLVRNWDEIEPFIEMADQALVDQGAHRLTFFEVLTVLAFAVFADAPIDVAVIEVGMGGEWDSTNTADAEVAVFTPIDLDHTDRLGRTITQIATTKSGIIKPGARVVSAAQTPEAAAVLRAASERFEAALYTEGTDFVISADRVAVGGQLISVQGRAGTYNDVFLPLLGAHQAQNAATAIAAVETFLGDGSQGLTEELVEEGLAGVSSPGRLQVIATGPTVIVDAAHNPHGARALAGALGEFFDFDEIALVIGILDDKDADGVLRALQPVVSRAYLTRSESERALDVEQLDRIAQDVFPVDTTFVQDYLEDALSAARDWAAEGDKRAVVVTGSITLLAEARTIAEDRGWTE
ncbi:MAG: bifunctional folylpolyglutamate synthase/dihydrofolate synthase [Mycetocola sp.]